MKKQKLINALIKKAYPFTPDEITELEPYEVFVFGSNLRGNHFGGAAKLALLKFGAIMGQGEGLQGQSYAFPTLDKEMERIGWFDLEDYVDNLIECALENPTKVFLLTKVGCGIAGFTEEEMIPYFQLDLPPNIIKPLNW
jgi:hypothetical protein